jgi:choline dehydrogenase-like flavoprotein
VIHVYAWWSRAFSLPRSRHFHGVGAVAFGSTTRSTFMARVIVVGAGLAGLVAAKRLAAADLDVLVLERRNEVGGRVRTLTRDGFTLDRGFQVLFTAYPAARRELDYDALDRGVSSPGRPSRVPPTHRSSLIHVVTPAHPRQRF